MNNIEKYLDEYNKKSISDNIYTEYNNFNYDNAKLFKIHLDFMLEHFYNIKIITTSRKRLKQDIFRKKLLKKFNYKCVITQETCVDELTAAHIVAIAKNENYDVNNGLILRENIHNTFDKFKWSINPDTLMIEIKKNTDVGQIRDYEGRIINLEINKDIKKNLEFHYNQFKNK